MNPCRTLWVFWLCLFLSSGMTSTALGMGKGVEPQRITQDQLFAMLGKPGVVILDVREGDSWEKSKLKIQGAVREDPEKDVKGWLERYPKDKTLIFYCSWPNEETSAWVARRSLSRGYEKVFVLKGGWEEWKKVKLPMEPK